MPRVVGLSCVWRSEWAAPWPALGVEPRTGAGGRPPLQASRLVRAVLCHGSDRGNCRKCLNRNLTTRDDRPQIEGFAVQINLAAMGRRIGWRQVRIGRGNNRRRWDRAQTAKWTSGADTMKSLVNRFVKDESGATAIEYGLIAAGISVAIIAVVNSLGSQLKTTFSTVTSQLATAGK